MLYQYKKGLLFLMMLLFSLSTLAGISIIMNMSNSNIAHISTEQSPQSGILNPEPTDDPILQTQNSNPELKFSGLQALPSHGPITIVGNANFTTDGDWTGSGTANDPYVFKDWFIDAQGPSGIAISATDAYFRIENVIIANTTNFNLGAFHLSNVANGWFENNTVMDSYHGFFLVGSGTKNNTLSHNLVQNSVQIGYRNIKAMLAIITSIIPQKSIIVSLNQVKSIAVIISR